MKLKNNLVYGILYKVTLHSWILLILRTDNHKPQATAVVQYDKGN